MKGRIFLKRKTWHAALLLTLCVFVSACGKKKAEGMPADTPWNHGMMAIMETDQGYYSNGINGLQCLRYYEKESGNTILLCNKPECEHEGDDSCEASYKHIMSFHSLLYDGSIYVLGMEENGSEVSINFYRGALDGSALDKVGTIISAENTKGERITTLTSYKHSDSSFIIHKGYAYIPYMLQFGQGMKGVQGKGMLKMNILTGETQEVYKDPVKDMVTSAPYNLVGVGDYVYYEISKLSTVYAWRYDISQNESEKILDYGAYDICTEERNYKIGFSETGATVILSYDVETGEFYPEEQLTLDLMDWRYGGVTFLYDDKFIISKDEEIYCFDKKGTRLGQLGIPKEKLCVDLDQYRNPSEEWQLHMDYKISGDKLYFIFSNRKPGEDSNYIVYNQEIYEVTRYHVFSCPLEDFFQGKGEWTEAFTTEGYMTQKEYEEWMDEIMNKTNNTSE